MINFFKKKDITITSPANGNVISIDKVQDEVFSKKIIGDGFAVDPENGNIYSPVEGKIFSIFPTKHAVTIVTNDGLEVLVHMGIETVELGGKGFDVLVEEGQRVTNKTKIASMNLDYIKENEKLTTIIVVFTNLEGKEINVTEGNQDSSAVIASVKS